MNDSILIEQYKALVGDVGNIGTRYATANRFYLSIVSALIGVVAFTESGKLFEQVDLVLILVVAAFAIVICRLWIKTLQFYQGLFGVKLQLLGEMETNLAFPAYAREFQLMKDRGVSPLIENEIWVPRILLGFFAAVACAAVVLIFVEG
jgi:hypothetical protein